jgi:hypothetical protein
MLTLQRFTESDLERVRKNSKTTTKLCLLAYCFLGVPASFSFGFYRLRSRGEDFWVSTFFMLIVFAIALSFFVVREYFRYYKDKRRQEKYRGEITITAKSAEKGKATIFTDDKELNKIELDTQKLFDKIQVGDRLQIEVSKYSKTLFKLEKNRNNLLNGH